MTDPYTMVQECMEHESDLTGWEREFLDSIELQLAEQDGLTDHQLEKLEEIWGRVA